MKSTVIIPLLKSKKSKASQGMMFFGLGIGLLLLFCSVQMYINMNQLLKGSAPRKTGFDYLPVSKKIITGGKIIPFTKEEIASIKQWKGVDGVEEIISNQFQVSLSAGSLIPFQTELFLDAIDDSYIDTLPPTFKWQPGDRLVPLIISKDFIEMYNLAFSASQGLPQISDSTISSLQLLLSVKSISGEQNFYCFAAAQSERYNTILAPKNFLVWANKNFAGVENTLPARLIIKTKDANQPELLKKIEEKNYSVSKEKTRFGRIKQTLKIVVGGLGVFGLMVVVIALLLFSFYLQLIIARSKENLRLLILLGYSPSWLSNTVARKWIPVYVILILGSLIITEILNWIFVEKIMMGNSALSPFLNWITFALGLGLLLLAVISNYYSVRKEVQLL